MVDNGDVPFAVLGLDHVNVTAPKELEDDVLDWYRDTLGLSPMVKPEGTREAGGWFRAGNQQVHVSVDEHNPPQSAHFGLIVDDYRLVVERLRAAGCHLEQADEIPGRHRFYTRDPAGNRVEILSFDEQRAVITAEESAGDRRATVLAEE